MESMGYSRIVEQEQQETGRQWRLLALMVLLPSEGLAEAHP